MKIINTNLEDCYILEPEVFGDARGSFSVPFNRKDMEKLGFQLVEQFNESVSQKGIIRGMHFQADPDTQAKIVRVTEGAVVDVVIDMRQDSPTYGRYTDVLLTPENHRMLYVPRGFAHGFIALKDNTKFTYFVDNIYSPRKDGGILWNDPKLEIPWREICDQYEIDIDQVNLKEADQKRPTLENCPTKFFKKYRYLVTGATGQLGYDVVRELNSRGIYDVLALGSADMDITDPKRVETIIQTYRPKVIIHCAAYTNVKGAEKDIHNAFLVNTYGTKYITDSARAVDAKMIYVSTDYVFDGEKKDVYDTQDTTHPLNVYGMSKRMGEEIVQTYNKSFIVRTSWVFGVKGNNFVKTMLEKADKEDEVKVVQDQIGSPTYTVDLARLLVDMSSTDYYGVYQAHNEGNCSWWEFTKDIYQAAGKTTTVTPILSTDYPAEVQRPLDTRMSTQSLEDAGFEKLPPYRDAIKRYLKELNNKRN